MWVVNYRNMKLYLNNCSCVLTDSELHVFKHCTNTTQSTPFNFSLCIQGVEYTERNRVYKGMMIIHHKYHLHVLVTSPARTHSPSKAWLELPPTSTIHPIYLNHLNNLCYCQVPAPPFFMTAYPNIFQYPLWSLPKVTNLFVTSFQQPAINARCSQ